MNPLMMSWCRKKFIIIAGLLEALLFTGCLFGWPSLLLVLQKEGIYSHLCVADVYQGGFNIDGNIHGGNISVENYHHNGETDTKLKNTFKRSTKDSLHGLRSSSPPTNYEADLVEGKDGKKETRRKCNDVDGNRIECTGSLNAAANDQIRYLGCDEQRIHMTLIYTVAAVGYGIIAILIGASLDIFGLRATRFAGSLLATGGFLFLANITPETSYYLWPALVLIAIGTNQLRLSEFQFADLWPRYRATILNSYGAAYSISTAFFLVVQLVYEEGVPIRKIFLCCGFICALTCFPTFFMPRMKIEIKDENEDEKKDNAPTTNKPAVPVKKKEESDYVMHSIMTEEENGKFYPLILDADHFGNTCSPDMVQLNDKGGKTCDNGSTETITCGIKYPFLSSLFSVSGALHMYWQFCNLFLVLFYSSTFNIWIAKVTNSAENVSFYIKMSGICCLIAPALILLMGIATDKIIKRAEKRSSPVERLAYTMQAPTFAMAAATIFLTSTMICKLFLNETAIYCSIALIALSRPAVVGSCTSYIRIRFPAEHFNILNGIFTTVISIICFIQYPIMKWMTSSDEAYTEAHWLLIVMLLGSLVSPGHMMIRKNIIHYAKTALDKN